MRRVNPIAEDNHAAVISYLAAKHCRFALLYRLGVETGLRVSDLLCFRACHIREYSANNTFSLVMVKTKKEISILISAELLVDILAYIDDNNLLDDEAIFWSRRRDRRRALTRQHVYRLMRAAGASIDLERIGSHSMRRTFAVKLYKSSQNIFVVQQAMGHRYLSSTMCYLLDAKGQVVV